ncbi:hypothetical protein N0B75_01375 [Mycoplasmopsis synoviae]|nr:hypothetical protein [Mycoplasmopsis synoviae]UZF65235.1 hypothetical protein N0B75_01375 [Mycoplasmopsis synoviae]
MKNDTEAVYFAVTAIASNNWLNTVLVRIPLTKFVRPINVLEEQTTEEEKFVRPITPFRAPAAPAQSQFGGQTETSQPAQREQDKANNKTKNMPQNVLQKSQLFWLFCFIITVNKIYSNI